VLTNSETGNRGREETRLKPAFKPATESHTPNSETGITAGRTLAQQ